MNRMRLVGLILVAVAGLFSLLYCYPGLIWRPIFARSVDQQGGVIRLAGPREEVTIARDSLGVPVVEAHSMADLAFGTGWAMASDRIAQMETFSLMAQGRLAELAGSVALPMDEYMRALNLDGAARKLLDRQPERLRQLLTHFSAGVNAWLAAHRGHLPMDLALSGYRPATWKPVDSIRIYVLLTQGLSVNLQEELAFLAAARRVGARKAAWLFPVYPDEPLPFAEADKLSGVDLSKVPSNAVLRSLAALFPLGAQGLAASNNWVIAGSRTASGKPILANDTHLLLSQPPLWMLIQMRCPQYRVGGIAVAGIPGVIAGSNGKVAWGMTMVMADTQDLFLEKLRRRDGKVQYLYQGKWLDARARRERFRVKDGRSVERTFWSTRHGPLINGLVSGNSVNPTHPVGTQSPFGLALQDALQNPDESVDALFRLGQARNFKEARRQVQRIDYIPLNLVYADATHIGWQVTGRYPLRKAGTGQLPSPGWTGQYDWQGFADDRLRPHVEDPDAGYIATANHRTVRGGPIHLSSSWYYPERFERIRQVLSRPRSHDLAETLRLQFDRKDLLVVSTREMLTRPPMAHRLALAIDALPPARAAGARRTLQVLLAFDGVMGPESTAASRFGVFEYRLARDAFLDELGPDDSPAWKALMAASGITYSAEEDHLRGRDQSPFWDDVRTPKVETKADILARALSEVEPYLRGKLGPDPRFWQWGRFHTYYWESGASAFAAAMPPLQAGVARWLGQFLNRGPYAAGGDRNTVNVAGHTTGVDFHVWDIPAMRLVVDFGQTEPLHLINSGGQSGNPLSPHYDDGIPVWLRAGTRTMPLRPPAVRRQYDEVLHLEPE